MKPCAPYLFAGLLAVSSAALADVLPGEAKAFPCTSCHGPDGMKHAPGEAAIGGRSEAELIAILNDYRQLRRVNPAMQALLLSLNERDIADIAEYFSLSGKPRR